MKRLALRKSVGCCLVLGCRFGRGPWLENKFCLPGECACVATGPEIWCSPCIGAGFDTLTFQSMIVHFFVKPSAHHKQVGLETTSIQKQVGIVVLQICLFYK